LSTKQINKNKFILLTTILKNNTKPNTITK
jgi:hypothetical protein